MRRILLSLLVLCSIQQAGTADSHLYIATDGNDAWSGRTARPNADRTDGPFATFERARDAIRDIKRDGPITIHIQAGTYFRDQPFELAQNDSGTESSPIVYRADGNQPVRIIGGKRVTGFRPLSGPAADRVDANVRDKILVADLKAQGITDFGQMTRRGFGRPVTPAGLELFFEDRPMTLARWPNQGYVEIVDLTWEKPFQSHWIKADAVGKFYYAGDRPSRWKGEDDIWLHGLWCWDWADTYEKVESIDTAKRLIATAPPYHNYGFRKGARYYVLNALAEIDEPGEWYLDRKSGVLYFWPPKPIEQSPAYVSTIDTLIKAQNVSHVTFQGLTLEMCRGTAVTISGGSHTRLAGCMLRNLGSTAVSITGGDNNGVTGCDLHTISEHGILISGGDRKTLTPARHYAENNHIYDYSRWVMTYRGAIHLDGVGNRAANNSIHDAPHTGIFLGGNDHIIECNEMYRLCLETDDAGAFYMGRDWTWRGNVVRYNYFHDIGVFKGKVGVQSVYLDDWSSDVKVYGNLFHRAGRGVMVGGGRDNTIENNVFVDCTPAVHVDSRGLGWAKNYFDGTTNTLTDRLNAMPYKTPPWSERYPQLLTLYQDEPAVAKGNVVARNICVGGKWLDLHDKLTDKIVRVEDNLVNVDPHFVDREHLNFQLRDDSPAFAKGFKRIPIETIGLRLDEFRTSLTTQPAATTTPGKE